MQLNDKWGFIDKAGTTILPFRYDTVTSFNAGVCAVLMDGKWGFIRHDGSIALPAIWEKTGEFSEGLCPVKKDAKWGLIDLSGKTVLEPKYDDMGSFDAGYLLVTSNNQLMYLDHTLQPVWKQQMSCPAGTNLRMYKAPA